MTSLAPLYQIEEELSVLLDSVETCPEELRPELEGRIAEYVSAELVKVDNIASILTMLEQQAENAKSEAKRLQGRAANALSQAERLEQYVIRAMEIHGKDVLKGRNVTFRVRESDAVKVLDPSAIPEQFKRTTIVVDVSKIEIKKAIKAGQAVPGADLEFRRNLVRK